MHVGILSVPKYPLIVYCMPAICEIKRLGSMYTSPAAVAFVCQSKKVDDVVSFNVKNTLNAA